MRQLWLFLSKYHAVFLFFFLIMLGFVILFTKNKYQQAKFFKSTSFIQANIAEERQKVLNFFQLEGINKALLKENQELIEALSKRNENKEDFPDYHADSLLKSQYNFITAEVITNQLDGSYNYITINKGKKDGIEVGNGIMTALGAVGKVVEVSENYSLVMSLFNRNMRMNIQHVKSGYNGDLVWQGKSFETIQALNISRNAEVMVEDTISTNHYSKALPENTFIGTVKKINSDVTGNFYILDVKPATDFRKLNYIYIVQNKDLPEIVELESNGE